MKLTSNFNLSEFTYSPTALKHGISNEPNSIAVKNLQSLCVNILQPFRDHINLPVTINSGYRCLKLNELVGGVPTSQHVVGCACDFKVKGMTPYEIASIIVGLKLPYDQLILYPTFVHVSYCEDKCRNQLLYNKSYKGKRL